MVFVSEHPVSITLVLLSVGIVLWIVGARRGSLITASLAPVCALAAIGVAIASWLIETPADQGLRTVHALVDAAETGSIRAAKALLSADATIHMGSRDAPGDDRAHIERAFDSFAGRHRIEENSIWTIDARTLGDGLASVDITCRTRTASSLGTVPTQWTFEVARQSDGSWRIVRIIWRAVASERPSLKLL